MIVLSSVGGLAASTTAVSNAICSCSRDARGDSMGGRGLDLGEMRSVRGASLGVDPGLEREVEVLLETLG